MNQQIELLDRLERIHEQERNSAFFNGLMMGCCFGAVTGFVMTLIFI